MPGINPAREPHDWYVIGSRCTRGGVASTVPPWPSENPTCPFGPIPWYGSSGMNSNAPAMFAAYTNGISNPALSHIPNCADDVYDPSIDPVATSYAAAINPEQSL